MKNIISSGLLVVLFCVSHNVRAQQFNTDNYLAMPHGMGTFLITAGTEYIGITPSISLANNWEFFFGGFLYYEDETNSAKYTTTLWAKYMIYVNQRQNGGLALTGGMGGNPSFYKNGGVTQSFRAWWFSPMITWPLFNDKIILDLNPALMYNTDYGFEGDEQWGYQYSYRMAYTNVIPKIDLVGEIWGVEGGAYVSPSWRMGVRWAKDPYIGGVSLSYSLGFDGSTAGGLEIGILLYTDQIYCFGPCKKSSPK